MKQPWKRRDDDIARAWLMNLDQIAALLGRTDREVLERLRELRAFPTGKNRVEPLPKFSDGQDMASELDIIAGPRGTMAMEAAEAEVVAKRVMLQLYRGSIEQARHALECGWRAHTDELLPLPTGDELLDVPLARVLSLPGKYGQGQSLRLLNLLEEAGILTVRHLLATSQAELLSIPSVGATALTYLSELSRVLQQRVAAKHVKTA